MTEHQASIRMSYELFRAAIGEPALLDVAAHWHAARGDRLIPGWKDIDPVVLGRNLPIIWAWRYDAARDSFVGRLAGEEIIAVLGVNIHGKQLERCFLPDAVAMVRERYQTVVNGPCFMRGHGKVFARSGGAGTGERIVLPLAADGVRPDGVFGATVYRHSNVPMTDDGFAIDHQGEIVTFYPLTG